MSLIRLRDAVDDSIERLDALIELLSQAGDELRATAGLAGLLRDVRSRLTEELEDAVPPEGLPRRFRGKAIDVRRGRERQEHPPVGKS